MVGRQLHKLSARKVETIEKPGRHSDGGGLYLAIDTGERARRAWVFMYRERGTGRRRELGLGAAKGPNRAGLTLADARTKAADTRKLLAAGKDPKKEREVALGPVRLPSNGSLPDWLISGGESGPGARPLKPQWVRDVIADCRRFGVAPFHKQWGSHLNNPLVVEKGMTAREAREIDAEGKGGGLVDGKLVREFPDRN